MNHHSGFAVLGAHGGAGVTTVARFLDPEETGTAAIELAPGNQLPVYYTPLVVARSTAFGMLRAAEMLKCWHPQLPRPWLVVVRDAPLSPPRPARYRQRAISERAIGIAHVPYLYRLRGLDSPSEALKYRQIDRAAAKLRAQLGITK